MSLAISGFASYPLKDFRAEVLPASILLASCLFPPSLSLISPCAKVANLGT
jgi:hypothetical protein